MKVEEARKMEGTEYIYYYSDGDSIPAYVKKFDPKVGLTCYTLEAKTKRGWRTADMFTEIERDGT